MQFTDRSWSVQPVAKATRAPNGMRWIAVDEIDGEAFPNVMRKVIAHGMKT